MNQPPPYEPHPAETPGAGSVRVNLPNAVPYATYTLIAITLAAFLLQNLSRYALGLDYLSALGVKYGQYIRAGQLWRLITPLFLHGSILHIAFNMYALFTFGRGMEARFGRLRFLALYFLSGFAGNVLSFVLTPAPSLGASTAVFGLLGAEGVFLYQNRELLKGQAGRAITNLMYMAGINLLIGFTTPNVDNWGHIGGLLGGLLFAWWGAPYWKVEGFFPNLRVVDERRGSGLLAGTLAVLLMFIPVAILGWVFPLGK